MYHADKDGLRLSHRNTLFVRHGDPVRLTVVKPHPGRKGEEVKVSSSRGIIDLGFQRRSLDGSLAPDTFASIFLPKRFPVPIPLLSGLGTGSRALTATVRREWINHETQTRMIVTRIKRPRRA